MSFSPEQISALERLLEVQFDTEALEATLKMFGLKFPKAAKQIDPAILAKKKIRAAYDLAVEVANPKNQFTESHVDWQKVQAEYGGAFCDNALKIDGKIAYTFTFEDAIKLADENRCEAITKTMYGYKVCACSIPVKGQATKPNQSIMAWTKKETEFEYPYDRTVVVADRRVMARFSEHNMKAKLDFKLHGIVPTKPAPEKPKKKATKKKAPKKKAPEPEPEMTPENVAECMDFSKLDGLEMKDGQITAAAAESEDEPELSVSEVWDEEGKSFYKDDEGRYWDYQGDGDEVWITEGEKPKETKKKFAHKKK